VIDPADVSPAEFPAPPGVTAVLDRLELAAGLPLGADADADAPGVGVAAGLSVREALEAEVLAALRRPPCVVSFSGGRDSSAMLALAVAVARREGLPDPVALTWRFPGVRSTDESDWQEMVITYLGVGEWEVVEFGEELEVLGELATGVLRRHGLLWPPNLHLYLPTLDHARGGTLLTGWDGDMLFGGWRSARVQAVLHGVVRPEPRDLLRVGLALTPGTVRREIRARRSGVAIEFPWLRERARRTATRRFMSPPAPRRWDRWVPWFAASRHHCVAARSLAVLATERDVDARHPLLSPAVLGALARDGGRLGLGDSRTAIMRSLFGDLLPEAVLSRRTKAGFATALWGERCRAFAADWDGTGADTELLDVGRLRAAWLSPEPPFGSWTVAQAVWQRLARTESGPRG
jgi:hypothetical protein